MQWNRTTTVFASIATAATAGYAAMLLARRLGSGPTRRHAPALSEAEAARCGADPVATRAAGVEAMRDPPKHWDAVDQSMDETFPASDPMPMGSRVD